MLGPLWGAERWPAASNARGLPALDKDGHLQPGFSWWVPYGEGWEIPAGFEYSGSGLFEWAIWIHVVDGKAQCLAVNCWAREGEAITAGAFKQLPLGRLVEEGILCASRPWDEIPKRHILWDGPDEAKRQRAAVATTTARARRNPRDHAPITDEVLRGVAEVYRAALASGKPTKAVAEKLYYSRASAGRLVMKAREAGFLPPTEPRQARG